MSPFERISERLAGETGNGGTRATYLIGRASCPPHLSPVTTHTGQIAPQPALAYVA